MIMAKNITLRPFAPKGLLTESQNKQLIEWWNNTEKRLVTTREIAQICGISRDTFYRAFKNKPERPFDELALKTVNKIIALYNKDIQEVKKLQQDAERKETTTSKEKAKMLIKKVGE